MLYPPVSVCPYVHPSAFRTSFLIHNLSIFSRILFKLCIHIGIGDEWFGIVNGQNLLTELLSFSVSEKWFLASSSLLYGISG